MQERDRQIALELKNRLTSAALGHVRRIIVFGSRARDEAPVDSDLDIAVLVDEASAELERELDEAAYSVMWDRDFRLVISIKVFTEAHYNDAIRRGFSFYRNVERDGVAV